MYKLALVILALLLPAASAIGGEQKRSGNDSQERFRTLDRDGNGYISHDEAQNRHRVFWYYQRADQNSDGGVDQSEFSAFEEEVPEAGMTPKQQ